MTWLAISFALFAAWRWWHWKREAYKTRDAAFEQFKLIRDAVKNPAQS